MKIFEKAKSLFAKRDAAEWDATDPAGDESLYDKDYAAEVEYDHSQFDKGVE